MSDNRPLPDEIPAVACTELHPFIEGVVCHNMAGHRGDHKGRRFDTTYYWHRVVTQ